MPWTRTSSTTLGTGTWAPKTQDEEVDELRSPVWNRSLARTKHDQGCRSVICVKNCAVISANCLMNSSVINFGHVNVAFGDYFCKRFLLTVLSTGILNFFIRCHSQDSRLKPFKIIREMNQNTCCPILSVPNQNESRESLPVSSLNVRQKPAPMSFTQVASGVISSWEK